MPLIDNPALLCGIEPNDGLLVAYLPKLGEVMEEYDSPFGGTLYAMDGIAIDILPGPTKWWKVRNMAFYHKLGQVELLWHGAALDFRLESFLDKLQLLPKPEGQKLHMRAYSRGPWINIEADPAFDLAMGTDLEDIAKKDYSK